MNNSGGYKRDTMIIIGATSQIPRSLLDGAALFTKMEPPIAIKSDNKPNYVKFADNRSHSRKRK
jgi:hypothetical protein